MDIATLWVEIETEYSWRIDELRFFQNQLQVLASDDEKSQFRRALILLLYAHYEGFCKFCFILYITAINRESIKCNEANYAIAAASLEDLFHALRHPDTKCQEFRNTLPNDKKLHIFAKDKEFVERSVAFENKLVNIPDTVVDTESNLKPVVLRKNLYRLGFPHDALHFLESDIDKLLYHRNNIAHGSSRRSVAFNVYEDLQNAALNVMRSVKSYVMNALQNREYLRN